MILFKLAEVLEDFHITQKELSEKTGIRAATINDIYHGKTKRFTIDNLNKICEALDCTIKDILEYIPDKEYEELFFMHKKANKKQRNRIKIFLVFLFFLPFFVRAYIGKRENMAYNMETDEYTCANGKQLRPIRTFKKTSATGYVSEVTVYECESCGNFESIF